MFDKHSKFEWVTGRLPTGEMVSARTRLGHRWICALQMDESTPLRVFATRSQQSAQEIVDFHCIRHGFAVGLICEGIPN